LGAVAQNIGAEIFIAAVGYLQNMPAKLGAKWRTDFIERDGSHSLLEFRDKHPWRRPTQLTTFEGRARIFRKFFCQSRKVFTGN
jgi:hypothetical protein